MAPNGLGKAWATQTAKIPEIHNLDLTGRTVIVTGSNVGLGLESARYLAAMKPGRLILAVRNLQKGEDAKKDILSSSPNANIEVWVLNMSSMASVNAFAKKCESELDRLDVAILNAGVSSDNWSQTEDGFETTLQVNVISTGLLAVLLAPLLERTAKLSVPSQSPTLKPHLTIVGSVVHFDTKFKEGKTEHPIHTLNDKAKFDSGDRYNVSKLLNLFIAREMAKKISDQVVINVVHPGLCESTISREMSFSRKIIFGVMKMIMARTTEAGARCIVWASLNPTPQGAYSSNCAYEEESDYAISAEGYEAQRKSWADLSQIWRERVPDVKSSKFLA